jgi:AcrR family transcriptional regulator
MGIASSPVRATHQNRSGETLERILDAAEEILLEKSFDEASLQEIATRAGVTIGAIYGRFRDKSAMLNELERRLYVACEEFTEWDISPDHWQGRAFEEALGERLRVLANHYKRHRGVARALVLRSRTDPKLKRRLDKVNARTMPLIAENFARWGQFTHPEPERALRFANLAIRSVCREAILFGEGWPDGKAVSEAVLIDELTRMFMMYLGVTDRRR